MGFDLSGNNPKINVKLDDTTIYGMIESIPDWKERWQFQDALTDEEKDLYWKQYNQYHIDNPGIYFRNNVWWWRPLWDFVCTSCEDILSDKDMLAGSYNDGQKISKTKAKKIANRLHDLLNTGIVDTFQSNHEKKIAELKKNADPDKTFFGSYPFAKENVEHFAEFCEESGGFIIC
jgi:hypothetical protein